LKLKSDKPFSNLAFNFNLWHYTEAAEKARRDTGAPLETEKPATIFDYYKPKVLEPVYVGGRGSHSSTFRLQPNTSLATEPSKLYRQYE